MFKSATYAASTLLYNFLASASEIQIFPRLLFKYLVFDKNVDLSMVITVTI